jgi:hypothetical protein
LRHRNARPISSITVRKSRPRLGGAVHNDANVKNTQDLKEDKGIEIRAIGNSILNTVASFEAGVVQNGTQTGLQEVGIAPIMG